MRSTDCGSVGTTSLGRRMPGPTNWPVQSLGVEEGANRVDRSTERRPDVRRAPPAPCKRCLWARRRRLARQGRRQLNAAVPVRGDARGVQVEPLARRIVGCVRAPPASGAPGDPGTSFFERVEASPSRGAHPFWLRSVRVATPDRVEGFMKGRGALAGVPSL